MPKSSKEKIEDDKQSVLMELQKNSSDSINVIAKRLGFSRQKVWRIIKDLENTNTIWGYTTIADVDNGNFTQYSVLIKRTSRPFTEEIVNTVINRKIENLVPSSKVRIENSYYVHGKYDWIITFTAEDIKQAKKFCEIMNGVYQGHIKEIHLMETMFTIRKQGILNPEASKLNEFF